MQKIKIRSQATSKDNFSFLLASLVFLFFGTSIIDQFFKNNPLGQSLVLIITVLSMSIGVWSIKSSRSAFKTGIGLILVGAIVGFLLYILEMADLEYIHLFFMLIFFFITLKLATEQALFSGKITANNLIGSICIYLILGLIWVMLYLLLMEFLPQSFSGFSGQTWQDNFSDTIYFSFVTLTTLGYGDIRPLTPLARFLVYSEVVIGVFYMAIVVSSLVGANISKIKAEK
ncbi:MAG: hypothetical protein KAH18_10060 [Psychromonas sp.]|nr:hypothetical protein [Psychromonas sp.]